MAQIAAKARKHATRLERQGKRLDVLLVDHLDKMTASSRYKGIIRDETREKSQGLAALAKDMDISVIALHQLNRDTENRTGNRPQLADLKHSGDIEADADNVTPAISRSLLSGTRQVRRS